MNEYFVFDQIDFESTVRDFEFTRRAVKQIRTVIESDDFENMDSEAIFKYLHSQMQIVSFKDYLKRYLYERAQIREPFSEVSEDVYREIIQYSFEETNTPHSMEPTSTKWTAIVKGWLRQDSVRRNVVFLLGFGLRMQAEDVSEFLTKVLKEDDFMFSDMEETIYWYCYRNGLGYHTAQRMIEEQQIAGDTEIASGKKVPLKRDHPVQGEEETVQGKESPEQWTIESTADARAAKLDEKEVLLSWLSQLRRAGSGEERRQRSLKVILGLIEEAKTETQRIFREDPVMDPVMRDAETREAENPTENSGEITAADLEKIICCGIPMTESGNLQKASQSLLSRQFQKFRLSRQRIDGLEKGKLQPDRYDLITLEFFLYSQKDYEFPEDRCRDFIDETNQQLEECAWQKLYPANPYEAFILMCLLSEYPLGTYADVWEMSYDEMD